MTKLSVNINKIATLRNSRGGDLPNVVKVALDCENFGAEGITVHPRPDERHIRYADVYDLKKAIHTEFNIEGYPQQSFIDLVIANKPAQVTLVPDPPDALTSNAGWDTIKHQDFLSEIVKEFQQHGIRTSIFTDTRTSIIEAAAKTGTERIELYTESYATNYAIGKKASAIQPFTQASQTAHDNGLAVNAGHDLNLTNLAYFAQQLPYLNEVSIGHALIADALYLGLEKTVKAYLAKVKKNN